MNTRMKNKIPTAEQKPKPFVKRKISLPAHVDAYVVTRATAAALPGVEPNISGAAATIIAERQKQDEQAAKKNGRQ